MSFSVSKVMYYPYSIVITPQTHPDFNFFFKILFFFLLWALNRAFSLYLCCFDGSGVECARVVYSPDKPLSCGAKVWIETYNEIEVR
jgi:hypothetical protein